MSLKKIEVIEKKIQSNSKIDSKIKEDLLDLMRSLKTELADINDTDPDKARNIADKTSSSAEQLFSSEEKKSDLQEDIDGLQVTVEEFEASHPKLVDVVNRFCIMLSDLGI